MKKLSMWFMTAIIYITLSANAANAQTTEFTFQGRLINAGTPANGNFDFEFLLFDALSNGTQQGLTLTRNAVAVANGAFTVNLDFANQFPGDDRFIEIHVKQTGGGAYVPLLPRNKVQTTPYAIRSVAAATADNSAKLGGLLPNQYVLTSDSRLSDSRDPLPGSDFYIRNSGTAQTASINISGLAQVSGTTSGATVSATNAQPGITNPSPGNPPPAALIGEATSTANTNAGVLGIANGSTGIGVIGITNGDGSGGQAEAVGVVALSTSKTGTSTGLSAQIASPNGAAIEARTSATGLIFSGDSDDVTTPNPKFVVTAIGQVRANASVFAKGFQLNSGNFGVTENGVVSAFTVETVNNMKVGGTLSGATDTLQIENNINIPGNITATGTITPGFLGGGNTNVCTLTGTTTLRFCSSSIRYKTNVAPFTLGLSAVKKLSPISFDWKEGGVRDVGFGAEDVAKIDPRFVTYNDKGEVEGVKYDRLSVAFVNAFREQQAQIEAQQKQNEQLQRQVTQQQAEIDALKALACLQNQAAAICKPQK